MNNSERKEGYVKLGNVAIFKDIVAQRAFTAAAVATALSAGSVYAQETLDLPDEILEKITVVQQQPTGSQMSIATFSGRFVLEKLGNGNVNVYNGSKLLYTIGADTNTNYSQKKQQEAGTNFNFKPGPQGVGIQGQTSSGAIFSANVGKYGQHGGALDLGFASEVTSNTAIALNAEVGPKLQRLLTTLGFGFKNGVLMFSAEHLGVKNKFQFSSGEVEQMVRQNSLGSTLKIYFTDEIVKSLEVSGYITKAQSYQLANKEYVVNNETLFAIYDNFRNIAGGEKKGVQAKLNFDVSKNGKLSLGLNYESLEHDMKYSQRKTHTQLGAVVGYSHDFGSGVKADVNFKTGITSTDVELGLSKNLDNGSNVGVIVRHSHGRNGVEDNTYVGIQYTIPFGGKNSSKPATHRVSQEKPAKYSQFSHKPSQVSRLVQDVVSQNKSFRSSNTIHVVDQKSQRILEIDKTQVPEGVSFLNEQGDMTINHKIASINSILKNGSAFSNSGEFQLVGESFVIKPRSFTEPAKGTIDNYQINLSKVGGGFINVTIEVKSGSIIISKILVQEVDTVDKTTLNTIISQAQSKKQTDYTPNSWAHFLTVLNTAIAVRDNTTSNQSDIDKASLDLDTAMKKLQEKANFSVLSAKLQEAQNIFNTGTGKYTPESLVNLQQAIIVAQTTLSNLNSTQTEVDNVITLLDGAIKSLQEVVQAVLPTSNFASGSVTKLTTDGAFTNTFTTNSPGAVTYSSSNTAVATVNASTGLVTIVGVGNATITANQAAAPGFTADTDSYSLTVNTVVVGPVLPTSNFASGSVTKLTTDGAFTNTFTTNSPGVVTYSSSNTAVATVNASTGLVTIVGVGNATITANQAAAPGFTADTDSYSLTVNTVVVGPVLPTSNFASGSVTKLTTDGAFTNTFTTNSPGAVTYSSSNTAVATVNASTGLVTIVGAGSATITANQAAAGGFSADTDTYTLTVNAAAVLPTSNFASGSVTKLTTDGAFTNTFTTNSPGAVTYSSSNTAVATVNASTGLVTIVGVGNATITANQAAAPGFTADTDSYSLTVNTVVVGPVLPTSNFASGSVTKLTTDASFTNTFTTNSPGVVTYSSSNTAVATVNASTGLVTIVGAGSATITANQAAAPGFSADTDTYTLTVNAALDNEAPVLTGLTGLNIFTQSATVPISVNGSDNVGITGYYVQITNYLASAPSAPSAGAGGWVSSLSSVTLPNQGGNRVYVWAKDAQGNVSNSVVGSIFFDNVPPTAAYTVSQPIANGPVTIRVTLSGVGSGGMSETQSMPQQTPPSGWTDAGWGVYERTVNSTASVSYTFADEAGNTVSVTPNLSGYTIDTTAPTASSTLPISVAPGATLSGTISFSEPVLVEVLSGGTQFGVSDQWSLVNSISVNTIAPTETGPITLQLRITDGVGLETTVSYTVIVSGLPD